MIKPLLKFELVGDKEKFFEILNAIKELGIVHIDEYPQKYKSPEITIEDEDIYKKARNLISDIEHLIGTFPVGNNFVDVNEKTIDWIESIFKKAKRKYGD